MLTEDATRYTRSKPSRAPKPATIHQFEHRTGLIAAGLPTASQGHTLSLHATDVSAAHTSLTLDDNAHRCRQSSLFDHQTRNSTRVECSCRLMIAVLPTSS